MTRTLQEVIFRRLLNLNLISRHCSPDSCLSQHRHQAHLWQTDVCCHTPSGQYPLAPPCSMVSAASHDLHTSCYPEASVASFWRRCSLSSLFPRIFIWLLKYFGLTYFSHNDVRFLQIPSTLPVIIIFHPKFFLPKWLRMSWNYTPLHTFYISTHTEWHCVYWKVLHRINKAFEMELKTNVES